MTDKYEREIHKFGMAYRSKRDSKNIFYPTVNQNYRGILGGIVECADVKGDRLRDQWCSDLTRIPEHDLVPASEIHRLTTRLQRAEEALRFYAVDVQKMTVSEFNDWRLNIIRDCGETARDYFKEVSE